MLPSPSLVRQGMLKFLEVDMTVYPSALDPSKIDALELQNHGIVIRQSEEGEINANDFVNLSLTDKERIKKAEIIKHEALEEAKRWFSIASDIHFNLEEIYSKSMDFTKNDEIINNKLTEIKNIIENSR